MSCVDVGRPKLITVATHNSKETFPICLIFVQQGEAEGEAALSRPALGCNRTKQRKFNTAWPDLPDSMKELYFTCGKDGKNKIREQHKMINELFVRDAGTGRDWVLNKDSYLFKQAVSRTDKTDNTDSKLSLPREMMLQKFVVTGEVSIRNGYPKSGFKVYELKVHGFYAYGV